jgi:hypothetical protein
VRLKEVMSVSTVLSVLAGIPGPSRAMKTSNRLVIASYRDRWLCVVPWLPLVQLRDAGRSTER